MDLCVPRLFSVLSIQVNFLISSMKMSSIKWKYQGVMVGLYADICGMYVDICIYVIFKRKTDFTAKKYRLRLLFLLHRGRWNF